MAAIHKFFCFILLVSISLVNCQEKNCSFFKVIDDSKSLTRDIAFAHSQESFVSSGALRCGGRCAAKAFCSIALFDFNNTVCYLYQLIILEQETMLQTTTHDTIIYAKENFDYLPTSRWSFDNDFTDEMPGNMSMYDAINATFVEDRFGNANASVYLNKGYAKMPVGEYMVGDFTLSVWVKIIEWTKYSRLLWLSGAPNGGVFFSVCYASTDQKMPYFYHQRGNQVATDELPLGEWAHLVFTMEVDQLRIYIDGQQTYSGEATPIDSHQHPIVTFGAATPHYSASPNAYFDDLMIFNRSLSADEVIQASNIN